MVKEYMMMMFRIWWVLSGGSHGKESACNSGNPGSISGQGRSLGEGNGNPSSILSRRVPWREGPGGLQSMGCKELDTTEWLTFSLFEKLYKGLLQEWLWKDRSWIKQWRWNRKKKDYTLVQIISMNTTVIWIYLITVYDSESELINWFLTLWVSTVVPCGPKPKVSLPTYHVFMDIWYRGPL